MLRIIALLRALLARLAAHLVDDWRQLHKFYSVRVAAIGAALLTAWPQLPDDVKAFLPGWLTRAIAYLILAGVVIGVSTKQDFKKPPVPGDPL